MGRRQLSCGSERVVLCGHLLLQRPRLGGLDEGLVDVGDHSGIRVRREGAKIWRGVSRKLTWTRKEKCLPLPSATNFMQIFE